MGLFISSPSNLSLGPWFLVHLPWIQGPSLKSPSAKTTLKGITDIFLSSQSISPNIPQIPSSLSWVSYLRHPFEFLPCYISLVHNTEFQQAQRFRLAKEDNICLGRIFPAKKYLVVQDGLVSYDFSVLFDTFWRSHKWSLPYISPRRAMTNLEVFWNTRGTGPVWRRPTLERKYLRLCTGTLLFIPAKHKDTEVHLHERWTNRSWEMEAPLPNPFIHLQTLTEAQLLAQCLA